MGQRIVESDRNKECRQWAVEWTINESGEYMILTPAKTEEHFRQIERLYLSAFPDCERKPFALIREKAVTGAVDVFILEEEGAFVGLAITMKDNDLVLLDYFAVAEDARRHGNGARALKLLYEQYKDRRFFLEIESTKAEADNLEQRRKRKQFYLRNGLQETGLEAIVFDTEMELLCHRCELAFEEYVGIYEHVYGRDKASHVILVQ